MCRSSLREGKCARENCQFRHTERTKFTANSKTKNSKAPVPPPPVVPAPVPPTANKGTYASAVNNVANSTPAPADFLGLKALVQGMVVEMLRELRPSQTAPRSDRHLGHAVQEGPRRGWW